MGKGRKVFRGKGGQLPESQEDMFEDKDVEVSSEEEEEEEEQERDLIDNSQVFTGTQEEELPATEVTREESPVVEGTRSKRARTERKYASLSPGEEIQLVEFYKENELFYNKKLSAYRDKARKNRVWEEQAKRMGKSVDTLEHWIVNMRTRYAKLIDEKSGMATREMTERDQWIQSAFAFLRPHIVRCPTRTSKVNKKKFPT